MDAAYWNSRYAAPHHCRGEAPNPFPAEVAACISAGPVLGRAEGEQIFARRHE